MSSRVLWNLRFGLWKSRMRRDQTLKRISRLNKKLGRSGLSVKGQQVAMNRRLGIRSMSAMPTVESALQTIQGVPSEMSLLSLMQRMEWFLGEISPFIGPQILARLIVTTPTVAACFIVTDVLDERLSCFQKFVRTCTGSSHRLASVIGMRLRLMFPTKICVAGGHRKSVEMYDPLSCSWENLPKMNRFREGAAIAVAKGLVYALGGYNKHDSVLASAECLDPVTMSWSSIPSMHERRGHPCAVAFNGVLHIFGGYGYDGSSLASAELFDPNCRIWHCLPAMSSRRGCAASSSLGNRLFVFGGEGENDTVLDSVEYLEAGLSWEIALYLDASEFSALTWDAAPAMSQKRLAPAACTVEQKVYVFGGSTDSEGSLPISSVALFDFSEGSWTDLASMPSPRSQCSATALDGLIYILGGEKDSEDTDAFLATVQRFNPKSGRWISIPDMKHVHVGHGSVCIVLPFKASPPQAKARRPKERKGDRVADGSD